VSEEVAKAWDCTECGGPVFMKGGPGRHYEVRRGVRIAIPDDVLSPVCARCGSTSWTEEAARRVGVELWLKDYFVAGVDPGVRTLVALLRCYGFETTDSGDGLSKAPEEHECALPFANVFIRHPNPATLIEATDRLTELMAELTGGFREGQSVEANYTVDAGGIIAVIGVTDKDIEASL